MTVSSNYTDQNGQAVALGARLGGGGEGTVYVCDSHRGQAVKIWHQPRGGDDRRKVEIIVATRPPAPGRGYFIAWPTAVVYNRRRQACGLIMPLLPSSEWQEAVALMNPSLRERTAQEQRRASGRVSQRDLALAARNYAAGVAAIHARGCYLGDINDKNVLIDAGNNVAIIDCDSFQVTDPKTGRIHRAPKARPEYQPMEFQGRPVSELDRDHRHDAFCLGVLIFKMLCDGRHPYDGKPYGSDPGDTQAERIRSGWNPLERRNRASLDAGWKRSWDNLSAEIQETLRECVYEPDISQRPTAADIIKSGLDPYLKQLEAEERRQSARRVPGGPAPGGSAPAAPVPAGAAATGAAGFHRGQDAGYGRYTLLLYVTTNGHYLECSLNMAASDQAHYSGDRETRGCDPRRAWTSRHFTRWSECVKLGEQLQRCWRSGDVRKYQDLLTQNSLDQSRPPRVEYLHPWGGVPTYQTVLRRPGSTTAARATSPPGRAPNPVRAQGATKNDLKEAATILGIFGGLLFVVVLLLILAT